MLVDRHGWVALQAGKCTSMYVSWSAGDGVGLRAGESVGWRLGRQVSILVGATQDGRLDRSVDGYLLARLAGEWICERVGAADRGGVGRLAGRLVIGYGVSRQSNMSLILRAEELTSGWAR